MTQKSMKRILKVTIKRMVDPDPDTSYMGEYSNDATSPYSIDRKHDEDCPLHFEGGYEMAPDDFECNCSGGDWLPREYRYFNPSFNYVDKHGKALEGNTPEEVRKYVEEDYRRMESLNSGNWWYIGIRAEAQVVVTGDTVQRISSGGLWGTESDSGEDHLKEIEQEELGQLRTELAAIGFSRRAIAAAFHNVERQDD